MDIIKNIAGIAMIEGAAILAIMLPIGALAVATWNIFQEDRVASSIVEDSLAQIRTKPYTFQQSDSGESIAVVNTAKLKSELDRSVALAKESLFSAFGDSLGEYRVWGVIGKEEISTSSSRAFKVLATSTVGTASIPNPFVERGSESAGYTLGADSSDSEIQAGISISFALKDSFSESILGSLGSSPYVTESALVPLRGEVSWGG